MHCNRSYGVVLDIVIILGLVSVALAAALSPILEHPGSPKSSLDASSQAIRPTVDVTFHGNFPGVDVSRSARIDVQAILYEAARKIHGTPDFTINEATWDAKQQSENTEKITFEVAVSGLRPEDCGIYTGFYFYSGVLPVPKARKSKSKPAKPNDRIERILTAKLLNPQGAPLLDLKVPEGRILQMVCFSAWISGLLISFRRLSLILIHRIHSPKPPNSCYGEVWSRGGCFDEIAKMQNFDVSMFYTCSSFGTLVFYSNTRNSSGLGRI
ncbi:hypothetical protein F5890DRAFT_536269 [Lentinula detonsa]|uniref:Uncharacterized protein n=1 Tax=Lentinula detonsa TaxID=2804962 RepID=A0AA38PTM3_9AGAR|nr:hypothetical protein F5890DRAFT_536269 [Lentinula detonsa]